eukprot:7112424-Lingulodinium_polyedra.AAC.1
MPRAHGLGHALVRVSLAMWMPTDRLVQPQADRSRGRRYSTRGRGTGLHGARFRGSREASDAERH